jgi:hypothetical protein
MQVQSYRAGRYKLCISRSFGFSRTQRMVPHHFQSKAQLCLSFEHRQIRRIVMV